MGMQKITYVKGHKKKKCRNFQKRKEKFQKIKVLDQKGEEEFTNLI